VALIHSDSDNPFPKAPSDTQALPAPPARPAYLDQMISLFRRHPQTRMIWAHVGLGRIIRPVKDYGKMIEEILKDPGCKHVLFDISWTETAKYLAETPETVDRVARIINDYPDRFLFGTYEVAPKEQQSYLKILTMYEPLLKKLEPAAREKLLKKNYERIFDEARRKVRAWEASAHVGEQILSYKSH
jgi:predicted TIM-barrel fold metal-dependent hydrolase